MRSLATALESYRIDWGLYPGRLDEMTTPIVYITDIPRDPLSPSGKGKHRQPIQYYHRGEDWILWSAGTDKVYDIRHEILESFFDLTNATTETLNILHARYTYDPTNGVVSPGDAWRVRQ